MIGYRPVAYQGLRDATNFIEEQRRGNTANQERKSLKAPLIVCREEDHRGRSSLIRRHQGRQDLTSATNAEQHIH